MTYREATRSYKAILTGLGRLANTDPGRGKTNLKSSAEHLLHELQDMVRRLDEIVEEC